METKLYLIAHKVRGEPAFDIAHQLQIGEELGWIIPTSGHRAYPYAEWPLNDLAERYDPICGLNAPHMPDALPDHYETLAAKGQGRVTNLLAALGLAKPKPSITRRL